MFTVHSTSTSILMPPVEEQGEPVSEAQSRNYDKKIEENKGEATHPHH